MNHIHVRHPPPPLGVAPHWVTYQERIEELSSAIQRYVEYSRNQIEAQSNIRYSELYEILAEWASDLHHICKIEALLLREDEDKRDSANLKKLIKQLQKEKK